MYVIIKDRFDLYHFDLSQEKEVSFEGIRIYPNRGSHYISLERGWHFSDGTKTKKLQVRKYAVANESQYFERTIFVYEEGKGAEEYSFHVCEGFRISADPRSRIVSHDPYLKGSYLEMKDGFLDTDAEVCVNHRKYEGQKLKPGDLVELYGFRFIYYESFLYLNHFQCETGLNRYEIRERKIVYPAIRESPGFSFPVRNSEWQIEELKEFVPPEKPSASLRSFLPNLVMASMITASGILNYQNALVSGYGREWNYLLMPVSMVLSGVVIPVAFFLKDGLKYRKEYRKKEEEYLEYLKGYEERTERNIGMYLADVNRCFFDSPEGKDLFWIADQSKKGILLSLGKRQHSKKQNWNMTGNSRIDEVLMRISRRLLHIDDFPVFLDLKEYRCLGLIVPEKRKDEYLKRFILELAYKYHYDDLKIAVYSEEEDVIEDMYDLPHLFRAGRRLSFDSRNRLQELDQMHLDRPVILFLLDCSDFRFSNPNLFPIHFCRNRKELPRDSQAVLEYYENDRGRLYTQDMEESFSDLREKCDLARYFSVLGSFNRAFVRKSAHTFRDLLAGKSIEEMYGNGDHSLKAEFAYCGEEILSFDLHEKKQGPHGLIAGSTGSGKSELIISMLLSLCIRYSPEYLNIVLIDYKGGGIRESLSYEGKCVPHIVASVSNLENNRFERLILALKQECIRRQRRFSELSTASGLSIMDIDDFRSCSRDQKMPHLLIVVDEFAELKKENPHLIRELISVSRIGRSLGLHLILATQRPSGNIDDEIWSNSRFKLSLKVFEEKDSLDVLKTKDAAYLEGAGSFLLRVDDSLIKARSIYAKYDMHDRDPYEVDILDQTLSPVRSVYRQNQGTLSQAAAFCSMILDHCQKNGIVSKKIDFEAPEPCSRKQLTAGACLVFGEVDDYLNGKKDLLAYGFRENILICSRRSNEINGIMNTLNEFHRQSILITHRPLEGNYICDCLHYEQKEDIVFLFEKLMRSDCEITVVIRDVQALLSCDDNYAEMLCRFLRRSDIRSNLICLSRDPRISYRLLGMFSGKILIDSRGSEDLNSFFSCGSRYKGNSYFLKEEPVTFVPVKTEEYQKGRRMIGHFIDRIPEKIFPKRDERGSLLGYLERERSPLFCKDRVLICSYNEELLEPYRKYGDRFEIAVYERSLLQKAHEAVLWIGPGIFLQLLFIPDRKDDLSPDQGIFLHGGKQERVRCLNHA